MCGGVYSSRTDVKSNDQKYFEKSAPLLILYSGVQQAQVRLW